MPLRHLSVLLALLAACGGNTEKAVPTEISGTRLMHYWQGDGGTVRPADDLDTTFVQAQLPGDGGPIEGILYPSGSYVVPQPPAATGYWLRLQHGRAPGQAGVPNTTDRYIWTDSDSIALDEGLLGRPDLTAAPFDGATQLALDLDGLSPWQQPVDPGAQFPFDRLDLFDPNAGFSFQQIDGRSTAGPLAAGDTSANGFTLQCSGMSLVDAAKGDQPYLVQVRSAAASGIAYETPVKFARASYSQVQGQTTAVSLSLADAAPDTYHLRLPLSAYAALRTQMNPGRVGAPQFVNVFSGALPAPSGQIATLVQQRVGQTDGQRMSQGGGAVFHLVNPLSPGADLNAELPIGNPYPPSWLHTYVEITYDSWLPAPEHQDYGTNFPLSVVSDFPGLPQANAPLAPRISPAKAVRINGLPLTGPAPIVREGVGAGATLSWDPPATGAATSYELKLLLLRTFPTRMLNQTGWGVEVYDVATLIVPGDVTSVPLPASLLQSGWTYALRLRAIQQDGQDVRKTPFVRTLPYAHVDQLTHYFSP